MTDKFFHADRIKDPEDIDVEPSLGGFRVPCVREAALVTVTPHTMARGQVSPPSNLAHFHTLPPGR